MMASLCRACGSALESAKERSALSKTPYSALFQLLEDQAALAADIHMFLSGSSYVCIRCCSTLNKYANIMEQLGKIKAFVQSAFTSQEQLASHVSSAEAQ